MAADPRRRPQFGSTPQWLTPSQEAEARRRLAAGFTRDETAAAIGVTPRRLQSRMDDQLRDARRGRGRGGGRPHGGYQADPTPEEIRERAAEVRSRWPLERWLGHRERDEAD